MVVGVTGASGFLGGTLVGEIIANDGEAVGFSRSPQRKIAGCREVRDFSGDTEPDLDGLDALVHLAGDPIMGLWTAEKKRRILDSRVRTTEKLVRAMAAQPPEERPGVFACASGVGLYGDRGDEILDEDSDAGFGFLASVVSEWEGAAAAARDLGVRTVTLRIGIVLGEKGGAFPLLKGLFEKGLGGNLGSGNQWMPWVHVHDVAAIIHQCLNNPAIKGPVNVVAPNAVTNREFTRILARSLGKSAFLPVPQFALKCLPGGMGEMFLSSQRVVPHVMNSFGYDWAYPELAQAIEASM